MHRLLFLLVLCVPVSAQPLQSIESGGIIGVHKAAADLRVSFTVPNTITYGITTVEIEVNDNPRIGHVQLFEGNDILRVKDIFTGDTWFKVSAIVDLGSHWKYAAIVMAGTKNVTYSAGLKVVDYGLSFQGFMNHVAKHTNNPFIEFSSHESNFTSLDSAGSLITTTHMSIGNLNGSYGLTNRVFGLGTGTYGVASQKWMTLDGANGIRAGIQAATKAQLDADGLRLVGTPAFDPGPAIQFIRADTGAVVSSVQHSIDPAVLSGHTLLIKAEPVSGLGTGIEIQSRAPSNTPAEIHLRTNIGNVDRTSLLIDNEGVTVTTTQGVFSPPELTTTQRDALPSSTKSGIIFNKSTGKYQGRVSGGWVDLH